MLLARPWDHEVSYIQVDPGLTCGARGFDARDPTTSEIRSSFTGGIACWLVGSDGNERPAR